MKASNFVLVTAGLWLSVVLPGLAQQSISVQIKGYDDGIKSSAGQDYKEAVLFAKREAIERAGVTVKSITTMEDFILRSDFIESQAEAVLEPGYDVLDIGYQNDGSYLVVLTGKVTLVSQPASSQQADAVPKSPLLNALSLLSGSPESYQLSLAEIGDYPIEKAYFANDHQFVIHYDYRNGVMTLNEIDKGIMQLSGTYRTDSVLAVSSWILPTMAKQRGAGGCS
ncbi:hypothetical protein [Alteromonas lipolytica]|uniref:Uncharacterized protein n=1 Tax=Alteromonas lipolytica TaxID=1856405 RepID=A0A1E8FJ60_9ALTE|nr:hypothetical protein [Alteromonas lipolytica]OFI35971.1 hypothetical protein BFC17_09840 [Alteromonas lipolytica]GGF72025.1 hypothetical protein GCM10011338_25350 [Alteromonas lipolytica]